MHLLIIVIILGLSYMYLSFSNQCNEGFELSQQVKGTTTNTIFDEFYVFLLDDLFFDVDFCESFCRIMLKYSGNVYNNNLCVGIKHGGHINEILKNNMNVTTISNSAAIVNLCNFKYKDNIYKFADQIETNSYIYNENEFTHISIIDNEIYYSKNINGLLYNANRWLINKGFLFIDVYDTITNLKNYISNDDNGKFIKMNYKFSNKIQNIGKDRFYLIENIKINENKKVNYHEITFYSIEYISAVAKECGFEYISHMNDISSLKGRGVLIFQKV